MINCNKSQTFSTLNRNSGQNLIDLKKKFGNPSTVVAAGLNLLLYRNRTRIQLLGNQLRHVTSPIALTELYSLVQNSYLQTFANLNVTAVTPSQTPVVGPHLATCAITMQLKVVFQKLMVWHPQTATLRILHSQLNNQVVGVITCNLSLTAEQIQWSHEATTDFS